MPTRKKNIRKPTLKQMFAGSLEERVANIHRLVGKLDEDAVDGVLGFLWGVTSMDRPPGEVARELFAVVPRKGQRQAVARKARKLSAEMQIFASRVGAA